MPIWTTEQDNRLRELCTAGKHRFRDMLSLFPNVSTDRQIVRRTRTLKLINTYRNPPKYTYDTGYFNRLTLESCYWAGILQTDGCLSKRGSTEYMTIIWGCNTKDRSHMELFRQHVQSTHPIRVQMKKCQLSTLDPNKEHAHCKLTFEGAFQWAADLKQHFGFDENKTLRTNPPTLPSLTHKLAYLKGLIDGDGTITHSGGNGGIVVGLCGCNKEMLVWALALIESLGLPKHYRRPVNVNLVPGESCYHLSFSGLRAAILHELLIRVPTPQLERKWAAPKALLQKRYWMDKPDVWPPDSFFDNILGQSASLS